ncbi:unannotated protein [freshwater metagenome]|uniref:Unannotated protein n=1 Tax=freshwater metagenome TaxID=449393 RepID=A0A6J6LKN4_9ZZZZ
MAPGGFGAELSRTSLSANLAALNGHSGCGPALDHSDHVIKKGRCRKRRHGREPLRRRIGRDDLTLNVADFRENVRLHNDPAVGDRPSDHRHLNRSGLHVVLPDRRHGEFRLVVANVGGKDRLRWLGHVEGNGRVEPERPGTGDHVDWPNSFRAHFCKRRVTRHTKNFGQCSATGFATEVHDRFVRALSGVAVRKWIRRFGVGDLAGLQTNTGGHDLEC